MRDSPENYFDKFNDLLPKYSIGELTDDDFFKIVDKSDFVGLLDTDQKREKFKEIFFKYRYDLQTCVINMNTYLLSISD